MSYLLFMTLGFELSKASIGTKMNFRNNSPIANVRCFLNLFAISNLSMINNMINTGGKSIQRNQNHGLPHVWNIKYKL